MFATLRRQRRRIVAPLASFDANALKLVRRSRVALARTGLRWKQGQSQHVQAALAELPANG